MVGVVLEEAIECSRFKLKTIEDCRFYNVEPEAGWLNTKQLLLPTKRYKCNAYFSSVLVDTMKRNEKQNIHFSRAHQSTARLSRVACAAPSAAVVY